jgi:hypothetical protein
VNDPVLLLGGAVVAVVFIAAVARTIRRDQADTAVWKQAAQLLGGDYQSSLPGRLRGHVGEYPVWVDPWGSEKATSADVTLYVEYKVWLDLPDRSLRIVPHGWLDESLPGVIGRTLDTGDPEFSAAFRAKADDVDAALEFLTSDRRSAMLRLHHEFPKAFVEFERLTLRVRGRTEEPARMAATVRLSPSSPPPSLPPASSEIGGQLADQPLSPTTRRTSTRSKGWSRYCG